MTPDSGPEITESEFSDRLVALVKAARQNDVVTEGIWTLPPYVLVITPDTIHITREDDLPE